MSKEINMASVLLRMDNFKGTSVHRCVLFRIFFDARCDRQAAGVLRSISNMSLLTK